MLQFGVGDTQPEMLERPARNKTTDFCSGGLGSKVEASHHRSLKQNDREFIMAISNTSHAVPKISQMTETIPEVHSHHNTDEPGSPSTYQNNLTQEQEPPLDTKSLKKQVKMEFAFLLNNDSVQQKSNSQVETS